MIKRIFHIFISLSFPFFVFSVLLFKVLFTDKGLGEEWIPDSDKMLDNCRGMAK